MFDDKKVPATVEVSRFIGESGVEELHIMISPTEYDSFDAQLEWVLDAYKSALERTGLASDTCVFRRFFCSDLPNQAALLERHPFANPHDAGEPCAVSWVCQPPVPPAKTALWAYHVSDPNGALLKKMEGGSLVVERDGLTHLWTTGITSAKEESSYDQTRGVLRRYEDFLDGLGLRLSENVIRTWFFVQNVDANYRGLVDARREIFARKGLTAETHFIASTGIQGSAADVAAKVLMDAYSIAGVSADQIDFLSAPEFLSPTHVYGVTFERGVSVGYRDRKHIFISGTASIDRAGAIVHPGDVSMQLDRTLENIEALLKAAGAALQDVGVFIVYVRDPSDQSVARQWMRERFGSVPTQVVVAPVCRPGWLIELECQAIAPAFSEALPDF
jgi:enamine deaminase RidA (YjgF/YER057c/UK114 family)